MSVEQHLVVDDRPVTAVALPDRVVVADRLRLDEQLCFALYAATNEIVRAYRPLLAELGLTYPQYLLLMALWEHDDQTVTELAETLRLPAHGLLPVLTRLEQSDLLLRNRDAADRRVVRITLTPGGRALERRAARVQHRVACQTRLPAAALAELRTQLHHLSQDLGGD
ncbi:MarR family winged helix-turn-helix transcriptional regulator [Friedmanniella luteola]|uniref:MarR family winged helix-turn-helix transcriptional regulator n=1 Tax=Friedmanniella luteola TaxID=546871 RepID=UPI0018D2C234|nr:MarR family transcriptional regulator [Friedmanniella luteola]